MVLEHVDRPAEEILNAIVAAVSAFVGRQPIQDDQTVLIVRLWREPSLPGHGQRLHHTDSSITQSAGSGPVDG